MDRSEMSSLEVLECAKINLENAKNTRQWLFVDVAMEQLGSVISRMEGEE